MTDALGYFGVLRNRQFLRLWLAQLQSLLALNSLLFITIILIEKVTQSTVQTAVVIAAFSLPAVFLSPVAGILVDRVSKKDILVTSNALRVVTQALLAVVAGLGVSGYLNTTLFILLVYFLIFLNSAIGQFFAPAEGAMIPLLVGRSALFAANSLFTLTVIGMQVIALVFFVPLAIKTIGITWTLGLLAVFYLGATLLLTTLPRDPVNRRDGAPVGLGNISHHAWQEIVEGWNYTLNHRPILLGILQYSLVGALVFVLATLAPGFASRVLGMAPEDAVFVFAPAGAGILIASALVVRFGPRLPRTTLPLIGMVLMSASLVALGGLGQVMVNHNGEILGFRPDSIASAATIVGVIAFVAGIALALILIPAQTVVQEEATDEIRGRVLTVQFTIANGLAVIPLLFIGGFADVIGIPQMTIYVGLGMLFIAVINAWYVRRLHFRFSGGSIAQALPLPGTDATTVRGDDEVEHITHGHRDDEPKAPPKDRRRAAS